jgi:hypothetical protein
VGRLQATEGAELFRWNIMCSLITLKSAWTGKKETINNCYKKVGFNKANEINETEEVPDTRATGEFRNTWEDVPSESDDEAKTMSELIDVQLKRRKKKRYWYQSQKLMKKSALRVLRYYDSELAQKWRM